MHEPLPECLQRFKNIDDSLARIEASTEKVNLTLHNGHSDKIAAMSVQLRWIMGIGAFLLAEATLTIIGWIASGKAI